MAERRYPLGPRDLARVFTPFHNVSYYAPEINAFVDAGMRGWWMAYFAYRAAPMGTVPAEVVIATFYNFAPRMIQRAVPEVWSVMSPAAAMALRDHCVDQALRQRQGRCPLLTPVSLLDQEPHGHQRQGDVVMPALPGAHLVLVHAYLALTPFEARFNAGARLDHPPQFPQRRLLERHLAPIGRC